MQVITDHWSISSIVCPKPKTLLLFYFLNSTPFSAFVINGNYHPQTPQKRTRKKLVTLRWTPLPVVAIPMRAIILPHWQRKPLPPFIAAASWRGTASKAGRYGIFCLFTSTLIWSEIVKKKKCWFCANWLGVLRTVSAPYMEYLIFKPGNFIRQYFCQNCVFGNARCECSNTKTHDIWL